MLKNAFQVLGFEKKQKKKITLIFNMTERILPLPYLPTYIARLVLKKNI